MKPSEYLDKVRDELDLPSDYALQKPLGLSKQQLSRYRTNSDFFSDEVSLRVADVLGMDSAKILLDMHMERSKSPEVRAAWMALMEKISTSFTNLLLGYGPHERRRFVRQ